MSEENVLKDLEGKLAKLDSNRANLIVQINNLRNSKFSKKTDTELPKLLERVPVVKIPTIGQIRYSCHTLTLLSPPLKYKEAFGIF